MENLPEVLYKDGYLRIKLANGEFLPETELRIVNTVGQEDICTVTVTFAAKLNLKSTK